MNSTQSIPKEVSEALSVMQGQSLLHDLRRSLEFRRQQTNFHAHINRVIEQFAAQAPTRTKELFFERLTQSQGAGVIFTALEKLNPNDISQCAIADKLSSWPLPKTQQQFFELLTFTMML